MRRSPWQLLTGACLAMTEDHPKPGYDRGPLKSTSSHDGQGDTRKDEPQQAQALTVRRGQLRVRKSWSKTKNFGRAVVVRFFRRSRALAPLSRPYCAGELVILRIF